MRCFWETTPAIPDLTPMLPCLSSVADKTVVAKIVLSSDGGLFVVARSRTAPEGGRSICGYIENPRDPDLITHFLADIIRFRLLMIAGGYEDGNDASSLRSDPMFKTALDLAPSDRKLCSKSTISRLENLPDPPALLRMTRAMVDLYCGSFKQAPKRIVLDIDDTFDAVYGGQQLRLKNAYHDEYGFQPIIVFDGDGPFVTAVLCPAKRPSGKEIKLFLRCLLRVNWPRTEILLRAKSHNCGPEVLDWCCASGIDYVLGSLPPPPYVAILVLEARTAALFETASGCNKVRRFTPFYHAAGTWTRIEHIIGRVEVDPKDPTLA